MSAAPDETSTTPPTQGPGGELVLVVGNLTIDDVVLPDGTTHMAALGGNSVHAASAVVVGGARAALVARRGEDFPADALETLAAQGIDVSAVVDVPGPTVRNWVVYESDGRRHWLYRTPPERSAQVAPQPVDLDPAQLALARVVHVAAMPLDSAEALVEAVRRLAPAATITLDTHESWGADVRSRVLALAGRVDVFVPSLEELVELTGATNALEGLAAMGAAGIACAVVKAGAAGAYVLEDGVVRHVDALPTTVVDTTGAGDTFCGGLAAGLARGHTLLESVGLGAAVAGTAITAVGSLRLFQVGADRAAVSAAGARLALSASVVPMRPPAARDVDGDRTGGLSYDIDVMRREIAMIPAVVSDVLDDSGGHVRALARRLVERGTRHLWLTGCGDSAFAGSAAALAFDKSSGLVPHPVHALALSRYRVRYLPPDSAVLALSFSGKVGRTTEAAVQSRRVGAPVIALTNAADGPLAQASDEIVPLDVMTLGFSPGTSTYVAMLTTLLRLAADLAELAGDGGRARTELAQLPEHVASTLDLSADSALEAARALLGVPWVAFLGAGPNEATARFGAAKLFEGAQQLGVATNLEEWAHEEYFVTSAGDPVVLVNPSGAAHDRGEEILSELRFMGAVPLVVGDRPAPPGAVAGELLLPLSPGLPEELSPVTACLPLSLVGFHLARLAGKQSYNFASPQARDEHYATIHRATVGTPA